MLVTLYMNYIITNFCFIKIPEAYSIRSFLPIFIIHQYTAMKSKIISCIGCLRFTNIQFWNSIFTNNYIPNALPCKPKIITESFRIFNLTNTTVNYKRILYPKLASTINIVIFVCQYVGCIAIVSTFPTTLLTIQQILGLLHKIFIFHNYSF